MISWSTRPALRKASVASAVVAASLVTIATDDAEDLPSMTAGVLAESAPVDVLAGELALTRFRVEIPERAFSLEDRGRFAAEASVAAVAESTDDARVRMTISNPTAPAFARMSDDGEFSRPPPEGAEATATAMIADVCPATGSCVLEFEVGLIPVGVARARFFFGFGISGGSIPADAVITAAEVR